MTAQIEKRMEEIQIEIKNLTEMRPPTPLPAVPMVPNLARGSDEMWQIYQYELGEYQSLKCLLGEEDFLKELLTVQSEPRTMIEERLGLLDRKSRAVLPMLSQPVTRVKPLSYPEKVERAKLIAKHLMQQRGPGPGGYDPMQNLERIKELQNELMDLEEQYHDEH